MLIPRLTISAIRGGAGKSLLSLGLCRAFLNMGIAVKAYKKGPDYIDAHWLAQASKAPCTNVDPYFLDAEKLRALFVHAWNIQHAKHTTKAIALIEGNRGLFDGHDVKGTRSTAALARTLSTPILLSLDITKSTRTVAAILHGLQNFEKDVYICGVVLNQVGTSRHESIVRKSIEHYTDVPVLGALPRLAENPLPERHMGLSVHNSAETHTAGTTTSLQDVALDAQKKLEFLATFIAEHCDLKAIYTLAAQAPAFVKTAPFWSEYQEKTHMPPASSTDCALRPQALLGTQKTAQHAPVRIGYVDDAVLWFYYEENLEALRRQGAQLVSVSLLDPKPWPKDIQGLYLGGGFPEEYLETLSTSPHMARIKAFFLAHMPIYAECGGFMVLAEAVVRHERAWPMVGIFPVQAHFHNKPQGLGYVQAQAVCDNPFHPRGSCFRGHEFHYSRCVCRDEGAVQVALALEQGAGMGIIVRHADENNVSRGNEGQESRVQKEHMADGLFARNTFASYMHMYAVTCPWWAANFVQLARAWREESTVSVENTSES